MKKTMMYRAIDEQIYLVWDALASFKLVAAKIILDSVTIEKWENKQKPKLSKHFSKQKKTKIMTIYKTKLNFAYFSDAALLVLVLLVISKLTGNLRFLTPSPTLLFITGLKDAFILALTNASNGGRTETIIKNQKRADLIRGLRLLASYVEDTSDNDLESLSSSGFSYYGGPSALWPIPNTPVILSLDYGKLTRTAICKFSKVDFCQSYEVRYTEDELGPTATWVNLPATRKTKVLIEGLTLGRNIWVQVRAINSNGESNWSDPAQLILIH